VIKRTTLKKPEKIHGSRDFESILLVEDEAATRRITVMVLKRLGYRVQEASSAEEALRMAEAPGEKIDLLMTDIVMPGMSGCELADLLQSRDASLKVLFMSGHSFTHHRIVRPPGGFLQKPFTLDAVSKKLIEVLDRAPIA
jgi:two-component system cell cycle sensor histidine kinase/response regulator CckA